MIKTITVEREYGSRGAEYAHHLADRLGWKLVDQCLIEEIAKKAGVAPNLAESCDERLDPWYYRFGKAFWHGSLQRLPVAPETELFDSDNMVLFVRDYLEQLAEQGNCVIVGRGAAPILARTPGAFHVFVYASQWRKVKWFEEQFPEQARFAEQELAATDRRRAVYIRRYFNQDWTDRRLYHLMLNSCMGFDAMVQATLDAAGLGARETASI
ncbi:cytidylate kinase-like family protein [Silvibacterium acidisoli]|uniref:cytidylate kinase-like family protein n=1 Tax=Acidobacteriaceae bacterium ZG23-2 TaxID=2883246 RepID=UPI00406C60D3